MGGQLHLIFFVERDPVCALCNALKCKAKSERQQVVATGKFASKAYHDLN